MSWKDIPGWTKFQATYDEAVARAPQKGARFLEIGTAFGRSSAYMGEAIRASGKAIDFHCIDPWEWGGHDRGQPELLDKCGGSPMSAFIYCMTEHAPGLLGRYVTAHALTSEAACADMGGTWDLIFIDGDHSYEAVRGDIARWLPKMRPGGMIGGDDFCPREYPGVVRAVQEAFGEDYEERRFDDWSHWLHYASAKETG